MADKGTRARRKRGPKRRTVADLATRVLQGARPVDPGRRLFNRTMEQLVEWAMELGPQAEQPMIEQLLDFEGPAVAAPRGPLHAATVRLEHQGPGPFWRLTLEAFLLPPAPGAALVRRRVDWLLERHDLPPGLLRGLIESQGEPVDMEMMDLPMLGTA